MNFLAHLLIADHTQTSLAGAVGADFVRGPLGGWPEPLHTGMALHRFIDVRVDQDPRVLALKAAFDPAHRRMAGILLDLAFDHQLARQWSRFHPWPLPRFSQHCYAEMARTEHLPERFRPVLAAMTRTDWLVQYRDAANIDGALYNIARRLSRPERLRAAIPEIWRLEAPIADAFDSLMPDLLDQAEAFLRHKKSPA
ncbi:ACP phosphodiesterase [Ferrimonas balearica]|uniref:acyl carrier protein phosphodiesterase n=1 Tax=Ferrimonas balearica TaxID=44012 RepID=UPI001C99C20C|nr:ACP phosphodiesterase [Ferrimonas balearica]MBY5992794.1 DUF479 domain-containing protein [Ferrimonas balearica]